LLNGGSATFTANTSLAANATGTLANTATVDVPANRIDPNLANNSATDVDTIVPPLPALTLLDNFNRSNSNNLGGNWSQGTLFGAAAIRVSGIQAYALILGSAIYNGSLGGGPTFGTRQGAAFTFSNGPISGALTRSGLILKANGGTLASPDNFIAVTYQPSGNEVRVELTTGGSTSIVGTFTMAFASTDTLSAVVDARGMVYIWRTSGATTTFVGSVALPTTGANAWTTGTGRIGFQLPTSARVDNFRGGSLP
jgi:hypothetical protein